mmetsp:Transcript_34512/g.42202  ORF Transcript_34512/g.42202 Transcript_34512/m.42202 type:complete len:289 (-) Transcript_34512:212-1078(-)
MMHAEGKLNPLVSTSHQEESRDALWAIIPPKSDDNRNVNMTMNSGGTLSLKQQEHRQDIMETSNATSTTGGTNREKVLYEDLGYSCASLQQYYSLHQDCYNTTVKDGQAITTCKDNDDTCHVPYGDESWCRYSPILSRKKPKLNIDQKMNSQKYIWDDEKILDDEELVTIYENDRKGISEVKASRSTFPPPSGRKNPAIPTNEIIETLLKCFNWSCIGNTTDIGNDDIPFNHDDDIRKSCAERFYTSVIEENCISDDSQVKLLAERRIESSWLRHNHSMFFCPINIKE